MAPIVSVGVPIIVLFLPLLSLWQPMLAKSYQKLFDRPICSHKLHKQIQQKAKIRIEAISLLHFVVFTPNLVIHGYICFNFWMVWQKNTKLVSLDLVQHAELNPTSFSHVSRFQFCRKMLYFKNVLAYHYKTRYVSSAPCPRALHGPQI